MTTAISAHLRRWVYLLHRWCGVAGCVLMLLWFISGIVMLFVGYPKLTPWDRVRALPVLQVPEKVTKTDAAYLSPDQALARSAATPLRMYFNAAGGQPRYVLQQADGSLQVVDARSGARRVMFDAGAALRAASLFLPQVAASYAGLTGEDRWTHAGSLNRHRPLHMVQMQDADATLLYVSSHTGEVVMQATRAQRWWNMAGAWLHWLYMFKDRSTDPVWAWSVIVLSAACVLIACSGMLVGIWRWRFGSRYRSGSHSPYQAGWMRWHHVLGLLFSVTTLTWIFSGLMSMNPLGVFSATQTPDVAAYAGGDIGSTRLQASVAQLLRCLRDDGFDAVELEWQVLGGQPYVMALDARNRSRLLVRRQGNLVVLTAWPVETLQAAATQLMRAPLHHQSVLNTYDAYYYQREQEAMMGGVERRLPVLRLQFADAAATIVYLDLQTGQPVLSVDRAQRIGRWLFNFLHSWDLRAMLSAGWWREAVLVMLSLGGVALSGSAIVIGWRRLRRKFRQAG